MPSIHRSGRKLASAGALLTAVLVTAAAQGAISYTGGTYFETFDQLWGNLRNASNSNQFDWTDDTFTVATGDGTTGATGTLSGWYAYTSGGSSVAAGSAMKVNRSNGISSPVPLYIFRDSATSSDVAFGTANYDGNSSGAGTGYIAYGFAVTNNTGRALTSFTVDYSAENWGSNSQGGNDPLTVSYSVGATGVSEAAGTWNAISTLTTITGSTTNTADGSVTYTITQPSVTTVELATAWQPGQTLFVRWKDVNRSGNDRGTGIDNVGFAAYSSANRFYPLAANDSSPNLLTMIGGSGEFETLLFDVPADQQTAGSVLIRYPTAPLASRTTFIALNFDGPADQIAAFLAEMGGSTNVPSFFGPGYDGYISLTGFQANYYKFSWDLSSYSGLTLLNLAVVPEPGAASLAGVAALGLLARRRRA